MTPNIQDLLTTAQDAAWLAGKAKRIHDHALTLDSQTRIAQDTLGQVIDALDEAWNASADLQDQILALITLMQASRD